MQNYLIHYGRSKKDGAPGIGTGNWDRSGTASFTKEIKSLNDDMNETWDYGVLHNKEHIIDTSKFNWDKDYRTIPVETLEKEKIGVCWDFVNYQHNKLKKLGIKDKSYLLFMQRSNDPKDAITHTFTTFELNGKEYWMESAAWPKRGVHEINGWQDVVKDLRDMYGNPKFGYSLFQYNPEGMDQGLSPDEFIDIAAKDENYVYDEELKHMTNYLIHYGPYKNDRGMSNYLMHFGRSKKEDPSLPIGTGNWRRDGSGSAKAEYKASKLDRKAAAYQRKAAELKRKSTRWFRPIDSEKAERKAAKYELKASKYSERASKIRTKEAKAEYKEAKANSSESKPKGIIEGIKTTYQNLEEQRQTYRQLKSVSFNKRLYAEKILSKDELKKVDSLSMKHNLDYMLNRISNHDVLRAKIKDLDEAINEVVKKDADRPETKELVGNGFKQKHFWASGTVSYKNEADYIGPTGRKNSIDYEIDSEDANGKESIKDYKTFIKDAPKIEKQIKDTIKNDKRLLDAIRTDEKKTNLSDAEVKKLVDNDMHDLFVYSTGKDGIVQVIIGSDQESDLFFGHLPTVEYDIRNKKMSKYVALNG